jgi:glycosyltransferase involved in cell wall biosynthesis
VLAQSFEEFELIVVDDGSSDGTAALLAQQTDSRIRILTVPRNGGACAARNLGIGSARGDLVCFLDSDDVYLPSKLEVVGELFAAEPELDLLIDSFVCRKGIGSRNRIKSNRNPPGLSGREFRAALFERRIAKATTAISVRRRALCEVGCFDERLRRRQDLDLVLRLSRKHVCRTTDRILWEKRESADAISRDHTLFLQASIDICDRHPEYLSNHSASLYRDLRSHFAWLTKHGHWRTLLCDVQRYAAYEPFAPSVARLMLDSRISRVAHRGRRAPDGLKAPDGLRAQVDSIQRSLADSGKPSRSAETSCAPASVE